MAGTVFSDIWEMFVGLLSMLVHNAPGLIAVAAICVAIYLYFSKPKDRDEQKILAKKQWEAGKERLPFKTKKTLALCPYPQSTEELKSNIYNLNYQPIGGIVGINQFPILNNLKQLKKLAEKPSNEELKKMVEDNKEYIAQDKYWVIFCCERRTGGKWLFPEMKHTLIMAKPNQIIDMNSHDNVIRVKGTGLMPIGEYELVVDNFSIVNYAQLNLDVQDLISNEIALGGFGKLGKIAGIAMGVDTPFRKDIAEKSIDIAKQPTQTEVKT